MSNKMSNQELKSRIDSEYGQLQANIKALGKVFRDKKSTKNKKIVAMNKVRTSVVILNSYVEEL